MQINMCTYSLCLTVGSASPFRQALLDRAGCGGGSSAPTTRTLSSGLISSIICLALATSGRTFLGLGSCLRVGGSSKTGATMLLGRSNLLRRSCGNILVVLVLVTLLNVVLWLGRIVELVVKADNRSLDSLKGFEEDLGNDWAGIKGFLIAAQVVQEVGPDLRDDDILVPNDSPWRQFHLVTSGVVLGTQNA